MVILVMVWPKSTGLYTFIQMPIFSRSIQTQHINRKDKGIFGLNSGDRLQYEDDGLWRRSNNVCLRVFDFLLYAIDIFL